MGDPMKTFVEEKLQALEAGCRQRGLSMTVQRRAILENLASRQDHPTADQIYSAIKDQLRGVSRTTVYRVLEAFVQLGIAQKICNPDAKARFDADIRRHHHAICICCEQVVDVHDERLNDLQLPVEQLSGFNLIDYSISFVGVCPDCRSTYQAGGYFIFPNKGEQ
jgi:Fur family peroxide stress response transcriptional regulator